MRKKLALMITLIVFALFAFGCEKKQTMPAVVSTVESSAFPITINGVEFESAPQKIVSLSPFLTGVVYDIKAEGLLVGVCDYCQTAEISSAGSAIAPDVDFIKNSGAELVLTTTPLPSDAQNTLADGGIKVLTFKTPVSVQTLENLYATMIAILTGNADFAVQAQQLFAPVNEMLSGFEKSEKSALCIVSPYLNAAGADTLCGDVVSQLANNAAQTSGYADITESELDCDMVFADNSLKGTDISEYTGNADVVYTDFAALENPNIENITALVAFLCENL